MNGLLDQTWRVYKSKALFYISIILNTYFIQSFTSLDSLWTSSYSLYQKLSEVFWFSKPWKLVLFIFSLSSPFAKKNSPRTNRLNSFGVSLPPFPKEQRTNRLNSFVCLPSPLSKNSKWHSLRILLILPFLLNKYFKGLTAWDIFCFPFTKFQRTNRLRTLS